MLPKTTPQQRARYYEDVDDLISPGFLSHNVRIGRTRLVFRTLGPGDLHQLRYRVGDDLEDWQTWAMASSIWMVNGLNVLGQTNLVPRLTEMISHLPRRASRLLFSVFLGLNARQSRAEEAVEAYMYENTSRTRWRSLGGDVQSLTAGIPGAETLGRNLLQQIWVMFNEVEDQKDLFQMQWEGFKLVASSNSPKGVRKIDEKDTQRQRSEDERRQQVMDRYYYYRQGLVTREGHTQEQDPELWGSGMGQKSVEQLEEEMRRSVAGELDEHDRFIQSYKQRILDQQAQLEADREERRRQLAAEAENRMAAGFDPTPIVGYTQDQLSAMLAHRGPGRRTGARVVYDETAVQVQKRLDRHVQPAAAGNLEVREGRLVDTRGLAHDQNVQGLQAMIESRTVPYGTEPQEQPRPDGISQSDWDEYKHQINPAVFGGQGRD